MAKFFGIGTVIKNLPNNTVPVFSNSDTVSTKSPESSEMKTPVLFVSPQGDPKVTESVSLSDLPTVELQVEDLSKQSLPSITAESSSVSPDKPVSFIESASESNVVVEEKSEIQAGDPISDILTEIKTPEFFKKKKKKN